ncbi:DUF4873 domain-containing protein [Candidatus Mycobacterium wuenschmannii]|uniref:DUF4873 domain-containing protein n=1 Tax=Candidatus Mycobacterium wuenschmannii TaxID=3027808 RepID=A0ABY8VQF3_9MYCO|nr:DUF4873 domain-containing protein [Candidatus Mycobacterium wuenschmannii]WIM85863.1 DUF4873 domain-containing protein [Candidatus Mycobacterium wuenschmannii]
MNDRAHDVVLIGDGDAATELLTAGVHDFLIVDRDVVSAVFDDDTDTWTLTGDDGETCRGRVVIACESPLIPLVPDLMGRRDFRATAMHAAIPCTFFDPAGKRVAVVGADSSAGALIERMVAAGARVQVFPLAPRRAVGRPKRTLRRRRVEVIPQAIEEVTAVGVRTVDGVHHDADAIVYGTGFAVRAGLPADTLVGAHGRSIHDVWVDGGEPYLGLAMHGFPNYFTAAGPDFTAAMRYIVDCLRLLGRNTRIEVRRSAQGVFNERVHLQKPSWHLDSSAFDVSSTGGVHDDGYEGPATLTANDTADQLRVALTGRVEPYDGQYHWQGTVFGPISNDLIKARSITITVGERSAPARITEQTAQGTYSISGAGDPPFPLPELQLT